ncbi:unnamed protein product [Cuscuta campestris]|uniref:DUF4283 domain-containing protein n=1 Tax=Cuscuta campestris TaxID=132261 RepID=A0A484N5L3_9ASTE|nr:unnamed protein product [Cuscuta campestris]
MGKKTRSKEPTPPKKKKLPELKVDDEATMDTLENSDSMSSDDNQSVNDIIEAENVAVEDGNGTSSGSDMASVDEEGVEKELEKNKNTPKVFEKRPEPVQKKTYAELLKNNRKATQGMQLFKVELNSTEEVFIPDEAILPTEQLWGYCLVGCFSGTFPRLKAIQKMVDQWSIPCEILPHRKGWIVLNFWRKEHRQTVLTMKAEELSIGNKKLLLKISEKDFMWNCKSFATMPVWVKLLDVPMGFCSPLGLSHIASFLGTPLYSDGVTHTAASVYDTSMEPNPDGDYRRVNFCRVMIDMDLMVKPPVSVKVTYNGGEYIQKIEYEDMPCYCYHCEAFGHNPFNCKALHEIHKRKFMEKQRLEEIATLEALKLARQAEARAKENKKPPHTSKTPHPKEAFKEPAPTVPNAKDKVVAHEDNGKKHLDEEVPVDIVSVDDLTPSFAVKDPNDGDTLMGTGSGKLTSVPIKETLLKEPPHKEGKDKATAQHRSSGRTGGNQYHGNNRGGGGIALERPPSPPAVTYEVATGGRSTRLCIPPLPQSLGDVQLETLITLPAEDQARISAGSEDDLDNMVLLRLSQATLGMIEVVSRKRGRQAAADEAMKAAEAKQKELQEEVARLTRELEEKENRCAALAVEKASQENRCVALEADKASLSLEVESVSARVVELEGEKYDLIQQLEVERSDRVCHAEGVVESFKSSPDFTVVAMERMEEQTAAWLKTEPGAQWMVKEGTKSFNCGLFHAQQVFHDRLAQLPKGFSLPDLGFPPPCHSLAEFNPSPYLDGGSSSASEEEEEEEVEGGQSDQNPGASLAMSKAGGPSGSAV